MIMLERRCRAHHNGRRGRFGKTRVEDEAMTRRSAALFGALWLLAICGACIELDSKQSLMESEDLRVRLMNAEQSREELEEKYHRELEYIRRLQRELELAKELEKARTNEIEKLKEDVKKKKEAEAAKPPVGGKPAEKPADKPAEKPAEDPKKAPEQPKEPGKAP